MLRGIHTRYDLDPLRALLEGDLLFWKTEDGDDGAGGSGGGDSSSQGDDDDGDDDDGSAGGGSDDDGSGSDDDGEDDDNVAIRRANRQAAKARVALKQERQKVADLEARLVKLEAGSSGGDDDSAKKLEQAEQGRREAEEARVKAERKLLRISNEAVIVRSAKSLGFADPDVIVAMVESGRIDDLDPDEELDREDVKLALRALKRSKPGLLGDSSTREGNDGGRGRGTNGTRRDRGSEDIDKLPLQQRAHARLTRAFSAKQ